MGGPVDSERQQDFLWELHLSELKFELQSNIVPIGKIRKGTYYHRALLFKVMMPVCGCECECVWGCVCVRVWFLTLHDAPFSFNMN